MGSCTDIRIVIGLVKPYILSQLMVMEFPRLNDGEAVI